MSVRPRDTDDQTGADVSEVHSAICGASEALRVASSTLKGKCSLHQMPDLVALSSITSFMKLAEKADLAQHSFLGSLNGAITLSVNAGFAANNEEPARKRRRDSVDEDTSRAVEKLRRSNVEKLDQVPDGTFDECRECARRILRMRGAGGENVVESWALSVREAGTWGAQKSSTGAPSVVIAVRLAPGVAIPLAPLCSCLQSISDGMVTADAAQVANEFKLPSSEQGLAAEASGQKPILMILAVPHLQAEAIEPSKTS